MSRITDEDREWWKNAPSNNGCNYRECRFQHKLTGEVKVWKIPNGEDLDHFMKRNNLRIY